MKIDAKDMKDGMRVKVDDIHLPKGFPNILKVQKKEDTYGIMRTLLWTEDDKCMPVKSGVDWYEIV